MSAVPTGAGSSALPAQAGEQGLGAPPMGAAGSPRAGMEVAVAVTTVLCRGSSAVPPEHPSSALPPQHQRQLPGAGLPAPSSGAGISPGPNAP